MADRLQYGNNPGVPDEVTAAWGCRAIVGQDGHVDVVPDRVSMVGSGEAREALLVKLNAVGLDAWVAPARQMLRNRLLHTRRAENVVLYEDDVLTIMGNTLASAGYLYVAAFEKPGSAELA